MADLLDVLGLSRPVAECAVCLEIYDDQLPGAFEIPCGTSSWIDRSCRCCCHSASAPVSCVLLPVDCIQCAGDCSSSQLDAVKLRCMQLLQPYVEGYMWQHGTLTLQSSLQQQPPWAAAKKGKQ